MAVINLDANQGIAIPANVVPGLMHVYCVGPAPATFGISIYNPPPPLTPHQLTPGHMLTFQVDNFPVWVYNAGPSRIQLLYGMVFEGVSPNEVNGVDSFDKPAGW
jgi:hypothetical protein